MKPKTRPDGAPLRSSWVARSSWIAIGLIAALVLVGCREERTRVAQDPDDFVVNADLAFETDDETYIWTTTATEALVNFRARDFFEGLVYIEIFDGNGELVFEQLYEADDNDDTVSRIRSTLPGAAPGEWTIIIDYVDFTGDLRLIVEG